MNRSRKGLSLARKLSTDVQIVEVSQTHYTEEKRQAQSHCDRLGIRG